MDPLRGKQMINRAILYDVSAFHSPHIMSSFKTPKSQGQNVQAEASKEELENQNATSRQLRSSFIYSLCICKIQQYCVSIHSLKGLIPAGFCWLPKSI